MPSPPRTPGVFVREVPGGARPIEGAETSVAAFVGAFTRGPPDHPVLVTSASAFERVFGAGPTDLPAPVEVRQFFHNGGLRARVVRTLSGTPAAATALLEAGGRPILRITAAGRAGRLRVEDPGVWGNRLRVEVAHGSGASFDLVVREVGPDGRTVRSETFQGLVLDPGAPDSAVDVVHAFSGLVRLDRDGLPALPSAGSRPDATPVGGEMALTGGDDGDSVTGEALLGTSEPPGGIRALGDDWNLLSIPDAALLDADESRRTYREAAERCRERRAFLLVDSPPDADSARDLLAWVEGGGGLRSRDAALHVPRLVVPDPSAPSGERIAGTSGSMAGLYARTDRLRGVWKAPAGSEADLRHVLRPWRELDRAELELLNPGGVNAIRSFPGRGVVSWGARTLAGGDGGSGEWRYVPVRRLALFIEESLVRGLAWTVFEPNEPALWAAVRGAVDGFLLQLFREGALQGAKAEEAWMARCGRETTTAAEIQDGILWLEVGFATLRPAEFIILRMRLDVGRAGS